MQHQTHLLSWCLWRRQAELWCSGCCGEGEGVPHFQPVLHLFWPQEWGWWEERFGSGKQREQRRQHSFHVALSPCSGTWHSQSDTRKGHLHLFNHWAQNNAHWTADLGSDDQLYLCWHSLDRRPEIWRIKVRIFHHFCNDAKTVMSN